MKPNLLHGKRQYDNLESIDFKYRKLTDAVLDGSLDMTLEQVSELKRAAVKAEYQDSIDAAIAESFLSSEANPRKAGIPEDRTLANGWTKDGRTGEVSEPECGNVTYWGEDV